MWSNLIGAPLASATEPAQDGWDEDDDLIEDSETNHDDDDVDDVEVEEYSDHNDNAAVKLQHDGNSNNSADSGGGGGGVRRMFVGRLTRFLEQVTHPDDDGDDYMEDEQYQHDDDDDGWQEDEVLFEDDQDTNMPEHDPSPPVATNDENDILNHHAVAPVADESHNAWEEDDNLLVLDTTVVDDDDNEIEDDDDDDHGGGDFITMRESIHQAEAALDHALEDIYQQEAGYMSGSDAGGGDLNEDAAQEQQAILEIQREMQAVGGEGQSQQQQQQPQPPVVDVTPSVVAPEASSGTHHTTNHRHRSARSAATSIVTQWATEDGTRDSGPVNNNKSDDEDIFQDENEEAFGPVVDQVPKLRKPVPMVRTDSLAVQINQDEDDEDDALDETVIVDQGEDGEQVQNGTTSVSFKDERSAVVDQTPSVVHSRKSHGESVDAILSLAGESTIINEEDEESPEGYGPVVDQIPENATHEAPKSGSVFPVVADDDLSQEFKTDDAMDETVFAKGDASTIDENTVNAWADDDVDIDHDGDVDNDSERSSNDALDGAADESADTTKISSVLQDSTSGADQPRQRENMVDYTPYEDSGAPGTTDPSLAVLAADEDLTRDTGEPTDDEVFGEENELDFAPVVDHTPSVSNNSKRTSVVSLHVEAPALEEDFQQDDAMDDTCFGDSTIDPNNTDDEVPDGWEDEDVKVSAVFNPHLVDQTPSQWESPPPKNTDPSVAVLASIDESVGEEVSEYGLVVDQTPHTPALPAASRSDSIIVQAADMDTVENESLNDDDDDDDGDTFTDEPPLAIGHIRSAEDILVDRVPPRPESRFGDASTMVAADPSEVLSEVDDMMAQEEEQNFGPIVDATPPSQAIVGRPSATGSTVAFAPNSVATDDLEEDDGDETETNDAWNETIVEEAPNPQSGNDEPVQQQEQLVDFLPEEDASSHAPEDISVMERTASSSIAIGGAQSLLQPEDPKEDDFGPVVDQTPTPLAASATSSASHVTASEMRSLEKQDDIGSRSVDFDLEDGKSKEVLVDYIPHIREKHTMDSLATVGRSQLTEGEEEEEETASKFGPVVDHLPTPRTSLAPSRGGSTVDALATVSEAESVGDDGNGWEDDLDLEDASAESDRTDRISTLGSVRRAQSTTSDHDRSVSVRFDTSVRSASLKPPPVYSSKALLATSQNSSMTDGWDEDDDIATDAADASSFATGEASRLFEHSIANAETPPSTPYNRPIVGGNISDFSLLQPSLKECPRCADSKSMECPCVQKLLRVTRDAGSLTGTLLTAEGDSLEVDFGEMLREEIAKRRLLEKETEALRRFSATQQYASETLAANETMLQSDLTKLREENKTLLVNIEELKSEGSLLRENSRSLSCDLKQSQTLVDELQKAKVEMAQRENAHLAEIDGLKKLLTEKSNKLCAEQDLVAELMSAEHKLLEKDSEHQKLQAKVSSLQTSLENATDSAEREANEMSAQLSSYKRKLSSVEDELTKVQNNLLEKNRILEQTRTDAETRANALQNEIDSLNASKLTADRKIADLQFQNQSELQRQYELLDARTKDLEAIEVKLKESEHVRNELSNELKKQKTSNAASAILAGKLAAMTKERDSLQRSLAESRDTAHSLQNLVKEQGMKKESDSSRDAELTKLLTDFKVLQEKVRSKETLIEDVRTQLQDAENEKDAALADAETAQSSVWDMQEQLDTANALLADVEAKADLLEGKFRDAEAREQQAHRLFEAADIEKKHIESRLIAMENKLELVTSDANREATRAFDLENEISSAKEELQRAVKEKEAISSQMKALNESFQSMQSQLSTQLQQEQRVADQAIRERETEIDRLHQRLNALSEQNNGHKGIELELKDAREWIGLLQKEKETLVEENEELLVQLGLSKGQMDEKTVTIEHLHQEMDAILLAVDAINNGVNYDADASEMSEATRSVVDTLFGLQTRYTDLEMEMTSYASDRERGLEHRIHALESDHQTKDAEIRKLRQQVSTAASSNNGKLADLERKIESLEHACREKDHVVQAKMFELTEARSRLRSLEQELHLAQSSSNDKDAAANELRIATSRAERAEKSLQHSQAELSQTKVQVKELEAELSAHEENLREMQVAQESSRRLASSDAAFWQQHAKKLEEEVTRKSDQIADLEKRVECMEREKASTSHQSAQSGEMDALRDHIASLTSSLQATNNLLSQKDEEIASMNTRMRDMEDHHQQQHSIPQLEDVGGDDPDSLRSHIVALATALEKSELRRAEAIERLMAERNTHAETMRRLGEQVRHFYSDLKNIL